MPKYLREDSDMPFDGVEWREPPGWLGDIVRRVKSLPRPAPGGEPGDMQAEGSGP